MEDMTNMRQLLEGNEPIWLPLLSGSMSPALLPGDDLYIEPKPAAFKRGDIAVFFTKGKFFSHRVILTFPFRRKTFIVEKGDANYQSGFITYEKALGRVTKIRRGNVIFHLTSTDEEKKARKMAMKSILTSIRGRIKI